MSNNQTPADADKKEYNPSVFSQDTLVGSDTNSLHPLIRNADGTTFTGASSAPLRGTDPQPFATDDYYTVSTRVVKEIPKSATKPPTDPNSTFGKLKNMLKPPVVKAHEALPNPEGKTYHVDDQGRIIETTVKRAGIQKNMWAGGATGGA